MLPACFKNSSVLTKAIAVISGKRPIVLTFKELLNPSLLWPTQRKFYFANKVQNPGSHWACVQALSKNFPDRLRITRSLLQGTSRNRCFDICLLFSVSVGAFPMETQGRGNCYFKMTSRQEFPSSLSVSANIMLWNLCFFDESKAKNKKRVYFRHLSETV